MLKRLLDRHGSAGRQAEAEAIVMPGSLWQRTRFSKLQLLIIAGGVAALGVAFILFSSAASFQTSTDPNQVIVQYSLPHKMMPVSTTNLATPMTPPFTLYGNGLLLCGHSSSMPFMRGMTMSPLTDDPGQTTFIMLSQDQIQSLLQQISGTGFFSLNKEYYQLPVVEDQEILRVSLLSGDHYVLYYGDVPAPAAYTQTISILQSYCQKATAPYVPSNVTLRSLKSANAASKPVSQVTTLAPSIQSTVQNALPSADAAYSQARAPLQDRSKTQSLPNTESFAANQPTITSSSGTTAFGEADQTVSGSAASALSQQFDGKAHKFVEQNGTVYELGIDSRPPKINNPLTINYASLRSGQEVQKGVAAKLQSLVNPKAYAATAPTTVPVRIVLLLATDGGSTDTLAQAQALGQSYHDWYCGQVRACYTYQGVSVVRGSQTMSYYMTCHNNPNCYIPGTTASDPLASVLNNLWAKDYGTIFRSDVDTQVVVGWPTGELTYNVCGYGFVGVNLSVVDFHEPNESSGQPAFCQPGHDGAHELGHTFGLNHTGNSTLMDGPPYAQYSPRCDIGTVLEPTCTLDSAQATLLSSTPFFLTPPPPPPPPQPQPQPQQPPPQPQVSSNRLDVFVRGGDNAFWHKWYNGSWSGWESLGGVLTSDPASVSWGSGRIDLFGRGTDNALWHKWYNGSWSGWQSLGGGLTSGPAVASWSSGRLDVFVRGGGNALYHKWFNGSSWSGWESLGGVLTSDPAAVSWGPGRLDVFARGGDNALWHKWFNGSSWSGWESLGGGLTSGPTVASWSSGRLDVFARGGDNALWHKWYSGGWSGWESLGGTITSDPAAVSWGPGRIDVFARGGDNALWHKWYSGNWSWWESLGGGLTSGPDAASWSK